MPSEPEEVEIADSITLSETDLGETEDSEESSEMAEVEKPGEYDSYLRKIWVEEGWDGGYYTGMKRPALLSEICCYVAWRMRISWL